VSGSSSVAMRVGGVVRRCAAAALGAALALSLAVGGCSSWSTTRRDVVDPIHGLLHHDYPEALESGEPAKLEDLFGEHDALAPSLELLSSFEEIEDARSMIERVNLGEEPVRARVTLQVEGIGVEGRLRSVLQHKTFTIARVEGAKSSWRIVADASEPLRVIPAPGTHFVDEAQLRGLHFLHSASKIEDPKGREQTFIYGSGVAAADFDDDGWDDVLLLREDRIELYRNVEGNFQRVSEAWGLGQPTGRVLTVALPLDYDGDARVDLFVGAERGQPLLLRNEGGRFRAVEDSGIRSTERTISAVTADFDRDGSLDLFLANHEDVYWEAPDPPGSAENAHADQLFLNNGDGTFRDATGEAGVGNRGWSLAPVAADYDLDGDVDLFVGNDFGKDRLFRNDGSGRFEEVSAESGVDKPVASMSADWGDFDGDGDLDLFVGGMKSNSAWVLEVPEFRIDRVPRIVDLMFRPYVRSAVRAWFQGNRLYENQGDGTFLEISEGSGAENSGWAWGSVWLDFDNDGRLDVYGANGFLSGPREDDL